jgi:hypothetical protein
MAREPVFYSFHYDNDVFRVQQIRNMGVVDGNEPVSRTTGSRSSGKATRQWRSGLTTA